MLPFFISLDVCYDRGERLEQLPQTNFTSLECELNENFSPIDHKSGLQHEMFTIPLYADLLLLLIGTAIDGSFCHLSNKFLIYNGNGITITIKAKLRTPQWYNYKLLVEPNSDRDVLR